MTCVPGQTTGTGQRVTETARVPGLRSGPAAVTEQAKSTCPEFALSHVSKCCAIRKRDQSVSHRKGTGRARVPGVSSRSSAAGRQQPVPVTRGPRSQRPRPLCKVSLLCRKLFCCPRSGAF